MTLRESVKNILNMGLNKRKVSETELNKYIRFLEKTKMSEMGFAELYGYCCAACDGIPSVDYVLGVCQAYVDRGLLNVRDISNNIPLQEKTYYPRKEILTAPFVKEMCETTANMYRLGWDERNGGNISYLLKKEEVEQYLDVNEVKRTIPLGFNATELSGKYFIVTGTGKYFKNVEKDPANNLGIVRISQDGQNAELLWGYADGGKFTSEFPAHLMSHMARLKADKDNRVVMHCHPTYTIAMNTVCPLDEKDFTHRLWQINTECIVVFPDGVGMLPWLVCGTNEIGEATASKMQEYRLVIWTNHGIYGAGKTLDETFGLIETVEKAAQIYMFTEGSKRTNLITDENLKALANRFNVTPKEGVLK